MITEEIKNLLYFDSTYSVLPTNGWTVQWHKLSLKQCVILNNFEVKN